MAYTLGNNCAKNLCKRTVLLQFIIKSVVTCFFGTQCIGYCKAQSHNNWQLQLNRTGLLACNCSTGQRQPKRSQLILQKQCRNQNQFSKWPPPALTDTETSPLSSYAVFEVVEISHASFVHFLLQYPKHCSQLDLNSANLEATIEAEWFWIIFLLAKTAFFSTTSQLCHHYVPSCNYWWDFLQFSSDPECQYDSCQKLWNVAYSCQSYGQNTIGPLFRTRCTMVLLCRFTLYCVLMSFYMVYANRLD